MRKSLNSFVVAAIAALLVAGCSGARSDSEGSSGAGGRRQTVTIKGSDTMVILGQRWAQAFMDAHPDVAAQVSGGGSGTGIAALINGTTDIANSSRPMKDRERAQIRAARGVEVHETPVALDAIAVYVAAGNPLRSVTLPQLKAIFRGQTRNWSELGWEDRPIILYSRENSSGTYAFFKEKVLDDEDFAAAAQTLPGTAAVINAISRDPNGIGYGGIAFAEGVRTVPIATENGQAIDATLENATSGRYPLARDLFVYTLGAPEGLVASYIDFILSDAGQGIVEGVGYYPLPKKPAAAPAE